MKKIIVCFILFSFLFAVTGCKKHEDASLPVRISFFNITPQTIGNSGKAWITVSISNLETNTVLLRTMSDYGLLNPAVTSTSGNPVYIEYTAPEVATGETLFVTITVVVMDAKGNELDRVEGRITVKG